jgi:hypothetical protein
MFVASSYYDFFRESYSSDLEHAEYQNLTGINLVKTQSPMRPGIEPATAGPRAPWRR